MLTEPRLNGRFAHTASLVQAYEPVVRFQVIKKQPITIQQKKNTCGRDCRPLVSVQKRMNLRQALEEGRSFLDGIRVISGLQSTYCRLQSSAVPKPVDSAELTHHFAVNFDDFVYG